VIKGGVIVARDGEIVRETRGRTLRAAPARLGGRTREDVGKTFRDRFEATTTVPFDDFPLPEDLPGSTDAVPARSR